MNKIFFAMKYFLIATTVFFFYVPVLQAQLYIQSGAAIKTTGNAIIALQDINLVNNGTINQQAGEGKFIFTGAADNTISGSSNPLFDKMEIAKAAGSKMRRARWIFLALF